jgi:hypothetical protein
VKYTVYRQFCNKILTADKRPDRFIKKNVEVTLVLQCETNRQELTLAKNGHG